MNQSQHGEDFLLTIGASRLEPVPPEPRSALVFPPPDALLKREEKTWIWRVPLPSGGNGIAKMYRRRGLWSRLRGWILPLRVRREFAALAVLTDGRVPCSEPLWWGWGHAKEHGHFEILITREIPDAIDLKACHAGSANRPRSADYLSLFDTLRRMHECGIYHGALWPKNILLTMRASQEMAFHLVDLARSIQFPGNIFDTRPARFDLLSLLYGLARVCPDFDAESLARRYGMSAPGAHEIAERSRQYRSTRHQRNWQSLAVQTCSMLAHLGLWRWL